MSLLAKHQKGDVSLKQELSYIYIALEGIFRMSLKTKNWI